MFVNELLLSKEFVKILSKEFGKILSKKNYREGT